MRWRWVGFRIFASSSLLFFASEAFGVDESRLWLPAKYQPLYLDLKKSALAAESLENCVKVVRGTIDRDSSTSDRPVFRILCRMPDGKTYNEMVDGITFETLSTPKVVEKDNTKELERKKQEFWVLCASRFSEKTSLMIDVQLLEEGYREPEIFSEETTVFHLDFNAKDLNQTLLRYRAICTLESEDKYDLVIRSRKFDKKAQKKGAE